jgi:hypothetical protein
MHVNTTDVYMGSVPAYTQCESASLAASDDLVRNFLCALLGGRECLLQAE